MAGRVNKIATFLKVRFEHARYRWTSRKEKFIKIYRNGGFGGFNAPLSGTGSTLIQTRCIREALPNILRRIDAKSMIDAPCGDFTWMKEIDIGDISYLGVDIVPSIINDNTQKYSSQNRKFCDLDIVTNILPRADLILCRDCFIHLSNRDIMKSVENFKKSNSKYLLTTTFIDLKKNSNLVSGRGWRPVNLMLPPFNFPQPIEIINEGCSEGGGQYSDKCLGLWDLSTL
jgi:hypothetical protein